MKFSKALATAFLAVSALAATAAPAAAQQLYECTTTTTITQRWVKYTDGTVEYSESYSRTTTCRPI